MRGFLSLSLFGRTLRFAFIFCLCTKLIGDLSVICIGHLAPASAFTLAGLFLLEFPCYLIASCYSLVLMFWLSVCAHVVPLKYAPRFKAMRVVTVAFNALEYAIFVTTATLLSLPSLSDSPIGVQFAGFAAIGRDFLLGLVFVLFVIALKIGLSDSPPGSETVDERRLILFTIVLSVFLLLRGSVTLIQGLVGVFTIANCLFLYCSDYGLVSKAGVETGAPVLNCVFI